jgi:predicted HD superfamily hydrolase involved in NAD metabolism
MIDLPSLAQERLSERRYRHVAGVVGTAETLAVRFGVNIEAAVAAAWLHDMYRETAPGELRGILQSAGEAPAVDEPSTWHGPACAIRMPVEFAVTDERIRHAVRWHTIGHPDMDDVGLVLYVADAIEPTRDYPGVEALRAAAEQDLRLAAALVADDSVRQLLERRRIIPWETVALRNRLWKGVGSMPAGA